MNRKDNSSFISSMTFLPCVFEIFIFQFFRFADWRSGLSADIQLRIFSGSLLIAIFFVIHYIFLFFLIKKFYTKEDIKIRLFKICIFAIFGFLSFIINYFVKY